MQGLKLELTAILEGRATASRPSSKVVGRYIHMYVYSSRVCNAQDESGRGSEGVGEARSRLAGWLGDASRPSGIGAIMKAGRARAAGGM